MPLYEFACAAHGGFTEIRTFGESSAPCPCPRCGTDAERVFSVPRLRRLDAVVVSAMDRNERSSHEPHICHSGCHQHSRSVIPVGVDGTPKAVSYHGPRPWVIEHAR